MFIGLLDGEVLLYHLTRDLTKAPTKAPAKAAASYVASRSGEFEIRPQEKMGI